VSFFITTVNNKIHSFDDDCNSKIVRSENKILRPAITRTEYKNFCAFYW
jgi:hypothetical protein